MKTSFENFILTSKFVGNKPANWDSNNYNNHIVTVKNIDNGLFTRFEFWGSIVSPEIRTERDLVNAFECFLFESSSGLMTFEEFCSEFGYDTDSRKAYKTYKACQTAAKKLERIYSGDVYELLNKINA